MKFRPCIDLHHGQVKQIVGSTLTDGNDDDNNNDDHTKAAATTFAATTGNNNNNNNHHQQQQQQQQSSLSTNFATDRPASEFAELYKRDKLTGGHVIMLGPGNEEAAKNSLQAYPNGLQVGGGINDTNAKVWLEAGASHVIVTSHVFFHGEIHMERLQKLVDICGGKDRLVLDLSCRKRPSTKETKNNDDDDDDDDDDAYYVVTDRWQTFTDYKVTPDNLKELAQYCDEFLVHGVDVEGKQCGILEDLVQLLGEHSPIPVTYAGGIRSLEDMELVKKLGNNNVDATIGSALDCFGGDLSYDLVVTWSNSQ